jgi:hypothetical protein
MSFKKLIIITAALLMSLTAYADEIGLRLSSAIPGSDNALVQFPPGAAGAGGNGKMTQLVYDWEPHPNFYLEGTAGYRAPDDIFGFSSMAYELSPDSE